MVINTIPQTFPASVPAQIEIKLRRMTDPHIHRCSSRNIPATTNLFLLIGAEQSRVMTLLHHDERDSGLVSHLQLDARLTNGTEFVVEHLWAGMGLEFRIEGEKSQNFGKFAVSGRLNPHKINFQTSIQESSKFR